MVRLLVITIFLISVSCSKHQSNKKEILQKDTPFESQQSLGVVSGELREASGLVASIINPGYLWTHNDSGNSASIYLLNEKGEIVMTCKLKNTVNRDWEDITIGPGPEAGINYIYVADIGDNNAVYSYKILYRIKEPVLSSKKIEITEVDKFVFELPDSVRDTEAIMVDPITNNFYISSKREHAVRLYEIKFPFASDTLHAVEVAKLPYTSIVAANVSADGREVLMKNYKEIYYWKRDTVESIPSLLKKEPLRLDYKSEPQGEAIAWKRDGSGFYTLSESENGGGGSLYFYKRKQHAN